MGRRPVRNREESALTRGVTAVFSFVKFAEFEVLFLLFFIIAFIVFKDLVLMPLQLVIVVEEFSVLLWIPSVQIQSLGFRAQSVNTRKLGGQSKENAILSMSRPEYNQILVKKPGGIDLWPY
ncbi:hypothetical protein Patl1_23627 [Pistacia atlantica]|uniref:Uncharacterized protein n=1 Tax=Pistacia atlantica TaxID=434234 RepID=A0ACC0ZX32_9ROSI|nr:hypothetical protein Patl1_23627 [Pistacia atlantica]